MTLLEIVLRTDTGTVAKSERASRNSHLGHERSRTRSFKAPQIWAGGRAERRDGDGVTRKKDTAEICSSQEDEDEEDSDPAEGPRTYRLSDCGAPAAA
ncbi:hypothetical protein THAOC_00852 [Thalassiosira oceanica]|uniref:Uncharacterized protein n=1 Tax=Thalassiosira oceanica TaxID=159749 RepID=K0TJJ2_THAOC|nr:hypothetical protein THAOC_00852 [Thalassiosira oceanica]|eukprot:EJK77319.1 hypothetical protein THAOC_00852 [Thalassiosira oceanica]